MKYSRDLLRVLKLYLFANLIILGFASISIELYLNKSDQVITKVQHRVSSHLIDSDNSKQLFSFDTTRSSLVNSPTSSLDTLSLSTALIILARKANLTDIRSRDVLLINSHPIINRSRAPSLA